MNVIDAQQVPRIMNLREILQSFLNHRLEVLIRRTKFRLTKIENRLEILAGYLIVFLNLDAVIKIIREEDNPRVSLTNSFKLTDIQVDAILNMRLRQLRKLEEIEIQEENTKLIHQKKEIKKIISDEKTQWKVITNEIKQVRDEFGSSTKIGKRRTKIGNPPSAIIVPLEAVVEREPITIVCSAKGWIRSIKGHLQDNTELKYKEGDASGFIIRAQTTDKLVIFATNGRFYTINCDKLPGGRGHGEPLRLMIDLTNEHDIVAMFIYSLDQKLLIVSNAGRGFIVKSSEIMAQTKKGKKVLNLGQGERAVTASVITTNDDHVASVGTNRKLLIFPLKELPEMARGRGNILQRFTKGGFSDAKTFTMKNGLSWQVGDRIRTETDLSFWLGKRAQAGIKVPHGFPKTGKFK